MVIYKFYKDKDEGHYNANIVESRRGIERAKVLHDMSIFFEKDTITEDGFKDINRVAVLCHQLLKRNAVGFHQKCVFIFAEPTLTNEFRVGAEQIAYLVHSSTPTDVLNDPESTVLSKSDIESLTEKHSAPFKLKSFLRAMFD